MTMDNSFQIPTLLPYLQFSPGRAALKISRIHENLAPADRPKFPFVTVSESGPFTRILDAQVVSDGGRAAKRVFLLLSKDEYTFSEAFPVTNITVDESWQRIFRPDSSSMASSKDRAGEGGGLMPFRSLFYCREKDLFFHPPCPSCGSGLDLCRDDELLEGAGLKAYSSSLSRYLSCPACLAKEGSSPFYAASSSGSQPAKVLGPLELIEGFGDLLEKVNPPDAFPCGTCADRTSCYGNRRLARSRITPFSFYPFFLAICEAASAGSLDFLSLLSGDPANMGWVLITNGPHGNAAVTLEGFLEASGSELEGKERGSAAMPTDALETKDEEAIGAILEDIISTYQSAEQGNRFEKQEAVEQPPRTASSGPTAAGKPEEPDEDFSETVILTAEHTATLMQDKRPQEEAGAVKPAPSEEISETIIIKPDSEDGKENQAGTATMSTRPAQTEEEKIESVIMTRKQEEGPAETVILSTGRGREEDEVPETVMLGPSRTAEESQPSGIRQQGSDEEIPETVTLSPGGAGKAGPVVPSRAQASGREEKKRDPVHEEDSLAETIILTPGKDK